MPVMDKFKILQANFETMKDWVGQQATFTYFERTNAGSYRHPLFKALRNYEQIRTRNAQQYKTYCCSFRKTNKLINKNNKI